MSKKMAAVWAGKFELSYSLSKLYYYPSENFKAKQAWDNLVSYFGPGLDPFGEDWAYVSTSPPVQRGLPLRGLGGTWCTGVCIYLLSWDSFLSADELKDRFLLGGSCAP